MFTIHYQNGAGKPSGYIVHRWNRKDGEHVEDQGPVAEPVPTLEEARAFIPAGRARVEHQAWDSSDIVETWL